MCKKILVYIFTFLIALPVYGQNDLASTLSGKILLQVESYGRAWYVYPVNNKRYYLKDGATAYAIMSSLGLGISNKDLARIPTVLTSKKNNALTERLKGRILLQVDERGEAWYVDPATGVRYYMKDGDAAYEIMRKLSLGINDDNLRTISVNDAQVVPDTAFGTVAYTAIKEGKQIEGKFENTILPVASMTKLMTGVVLLDYGIELDKKITITEDVINYPRHYVGDDPTSEIKLEAGDTLTVYDLWVSMLLASSNQAAAALTKQTGLSFDEFIDRMNTKAAALNLNKTLFFDVAGLDSHNVATPFEMAVIADFAFSDPLIAELSTLSTYTVKITSKNGVLRELTIPNRNTSVMRYNPVGVKTGYLVEAKLNVALKKDDIVIVVMHATSMKERNQIIEALLK